MLVVLHVVQDSTVIKEQTDVKIVRLATCAMEMPRLPHQLLLAKEGSFVHQVHTVQLVRLHQLVVQWELTPLTLETVNLIYVYHVL